LGEITSAKTMLIPLDRPGLMTEGEILKARLGNFRFCGVFAVRDGVVQAVPDDDIDARLLMLNACNDYAAWVAENMRPADGWLERLWSLPDTREMN
jgi:hypothetical protein